MSTPSPLHLSATLRGELIASSLAINTLMLAMPIATLQIYDRVLTHPGSGTLLMLCVGVACAVVMETLLRLARSYLTGQVAQAFEQQRSERLVAHTLHSWVEPAQNRHHSEYMQALGAVTRVKDYALQRLLTLSVDVPYIGIFLLLLWMIGGVLVLVPMLAVSLFGVLVVWGGVKLKHAIRTRNRTDEMRYGYLLETLAGVHVIKAMGLEPRFIHHYRALQAQAGKSGLAIAGLNHALAAAAALFSQVMVVLVVAGGAPMVMHGTISMGALIACVLLSGRLIQPLQHMLLCWIGYQEFEQAQGQIGQIERLPLQPLQAQADAAMDGRVQCAQLCFRYHEESAWVVDAVSLALEPGEAVAIGGESSSGRSTLLKLMAGLLPPDAGEVRIDGMNPAHWPPHQLARHVAYLTPEPTLLRGSLMENITGFDASMQERGHELARWLGLDALVSQLPQGFDTKLEGAQAETIPPGLRQRVAMVRALLHKPKLILFDQADRSLDREGYHQLFRLLARVKGKASMVLVADDQNLMRLCDRTLVMRDGRLLPQPGSEARGGLRHLRLVGAGGNA